MMRFLEDSGNQHQTVSLKISQKSWQIIKIIFILSSHKKSL
jgi:hypothetical protein